MSENNRKTYKRIVSTIFSILTILVDLLIPFLVLGDSNMLLMTGFCFLLAIPLSIGNYFLVQKLCKKVSMHPLFLFAISVVVEIIIVIGVYGLAKKGDDGIGYCIFVACMETGKALGITFTASQAGFIGAHISFLVAALRRLKKPANS